MTATVTRCVRTPTSPRLRCHCGGRTGGPDRSRGRKGAPGLPTLAGVRARARRRAPRASPDRRRLRRIAGPGAGTLGRLAGSGQEFGLLPGSADFGPGPVRYSFLLLDQHGQSIDHPAAHLDRPCAGRRAARRVRPVPEDAAPLESTAPPGDAGEAHMQYVLHARIARPGKFWVLARPPGSSDVHGVGDFIVQPKAHSPAIGSRAPASQTPVLRHRADPAADDEDPARPRPAPLLGRREPARARPVRRHLRDAEVLLEQDVRAGRRRRRPRAQAVRRLRRSFHPCGDLQGQQPGPRLQPLGSAVASADRALDVPRGPRRPDQGEVRGRALGERAGSGGERRYAP